MKIGIAGYQGRVGQLLVKELQSGTWAALSLAGGSALEETVESYPTFDTADGLFGVSDCVIDFTAPESTLKNVRAAAASGKSLIIGTTGLNADIESEIKIAAQKSAILYSANMSVGVNLLMALVEQAAARLGPEWDIEIFESHHKNKIDAPSGTALALGKSAKAGRNGMGEFVVDRNGKRREGDIGFSVDRGGDVVGEHMVTFYGMGERVELGHKASDRSLFVRGALRAAQWLDGKPAGLYSMRDVLGLNL